jgi:hypothetical protein
MAAKRKRGGASLTAILHKTLQTIKALHVSEGFFLTDRFINKVNQFLGTYLALF